MRNRWLSSPLWVVRLATGTFFGLCMAVFGTVTQDDSLWLAVILGTLSGAFFGLAAGTWVYRQNQQALASTGGRGFNPAVRRAMRGGPAPADEDDRVAALAMVELYVDQLEAQRRWSLPFYGVMIALATWLALSRSPWWWAGMVFWILVIVGTVWTRRRLVRRRDVLVRAAAGG